MLRADTNIDYKIAAIDEATLGEFGQNHAAKHRIVGQRQHTDSPNLIWLLRMHRQRPRRDACEASNELSCWFEGGDLKDKPWAEIEGRLQPPFHRRGNAMGVLG
jgi:hypothetical protein